MTDDLERDKIEDPTQQDLESLWESLGEDPPGPVVTKNQRAH